MYYRLLRILGCLFPCSFNHAWRMKVVSPVDYRKKAVLGSLGRERESVSFQSLELAPSGTQVPLPIAFTPGLAGVQPCEFWVLIQTLFTSSYSLAKPGNFWSIFVFLKLLQTFKSRLLASSWKSASGMGCSKPEAPKGMWKCWLVAGKEDRQPWESGSCPIPAAGHPCLAALAAVCSCAKQDPNAVRSGG